MSHHLLALALVVAPSFALAQSAEAPLIVTGKTAKVVGAAEVKLPDPKATDGGAANPKMGATEFLATIRDVCPMLVNDGKLFAACDTSNPLARRPGPTFLPRTTTEWEKFAARVSDADRTVNGKPRPVVILNGGAVIAEVSTVGRVTLKK